MLTYTCPQCEKVIRSLYKEQLYQNIETHKRACDIKFREKLKGEVNGKTKTRN
jgi:hypothetical protein